MNENIDWKKIFLTALGIAWYPHLIEPTVKYNKQGLYDVWMEFPDEDEAALAEKLTALFDAAYGLNCKKEMMSVLKKASLPWKEGKDGNLQFHFKMTASGVNENGKAWTRRPQIFDAQLNEIDIEAVPNLHIGSCSQLIVMYRVHPFYTKMIGSGISLRLEGVQIHRYVDWKRDADFYGLKRDENGWDYKAASKKKPPTPVAPADAPVEPEPEYIPDQTAEDTGDIDQMTA